MGFGEITIAETIAKDGLVASKPKGRKRRTVPIPEQTIALLNELRRSASPDNPYVLVPDGRWHYIRENMKTVGGWPEGRAAIHNLSRYWQELVKVAGVPGICPHDLRRSAITRWAKTCPMHITQMFAGHSTITTTAQFYTVVDADDMAMARKAMADALSKTA